MANAHSYSVLLQGFVIGMACIYSGGHLEIQYDVIAVGTIRLTGPKNLGIAT
jgi:hypothetical protein